MMEYISLHPTDFDFEQYMTMTNNYDDVIPRLILWLLISLYLKQIMISIATPLIGNLDEYESSHSVLGTTITTTRDKDNK